MGRFAHRARRAAHRAEAAGRVRPTVDLAAAVSPPRCANCAYETCVPPRPCDRYVTGELDAILMFEGGW